MTEIEGKGAHYAFVPLPLLSPKRSYPLPLRGIGEGGLSKVKIKRGRNLGERRRRCLNSSLGTRSNVPFGEEI